MANYKYYVDCIMDQLAPQKRELMEVKKSLKVLQSDKRDFRIVVAGGFSSGKSAFINHVLGSDVAVEGTTATTRCSTEYFFSHEKRWLADGKSISETSYRDLSSQKGSTAHFCVGVPSDFLKPNVLVVDTPGYGDNQSDNDNATREIRNCDILFWLVNANDGTFHETELDVLVEATKLVEEGRNPLAVFLTQIDTLTPQYDPIKPNKMMTGAEVLEKIRTTIVKQLQERKLRLICPPHAVSIKDIQDITPSLREFVKNQDTDIVRIVAKCKEEASCLSHLREKVLEKKLNEYVEGIRGKCSGGITYLLKQKEDQEKRILRAEYAKECEFKNKLVDIVAEHIYCVGTKVDFCNAAIVSQKSADRLIWDDYVAEFNGKLDFLHAQELYKTIGRLLADYSDDYCGIPYQCPDAIKAVLNEVSNSMQSVNADSWSWNNETIARAAMAEQVRNVLCANYQSLAKDVFLKAFKSPDLNWSSLNISTMRSNLKEIGKAVKRLSDMIQDVENCS